jgi:hypothetical protein
MSISGMLLLRMFLRSTNRRKDGKDHRYFSVVENRRLPGGKTTQRTVLYLGEINDPRAGGILFREGLHRILVLAAITATIKTFR